MQRNTIIKYILLVQEHFSVFIYSLKNREFLLLFTLIAKPLFKDCLVWMTPFQNWETTQPLLVIGSVSNWSKGWYSYFFDVQRTMIIRHKYSLLISIIDGVLRAPSNTLGSLWQIRNWLEEGVQIRCELSWYVFAVCR